jgi:hypothetical protein
MEYALLYVEQHAISFVIAAFSVGSFVGIFVMAIMAASGRADLDAEIMQLQADIENLRRLGAAKDVVAQKLKDDIVELKKQKPLKTGFDFNGARQKTHIKLFQNNPEEFEISKQGGLI